MIEPRDFIRTVMQSAEQDITEYIHLCKQIFELSFEGEDSRDATERLIARRSELEKKHGLVDHATSAASKQRTSRKRMGGKIHS